ncbi:helix-turn-helix transcriptional regulator [Dolosigranulum pigrum]|uniref:helix-turn-helix transcriptional regulator n=1 Tax=Dolosigranulum pigrum TaxID=29394 RepID=UPI000DC55100|nr:helix-turn-helix transcriptional regulator [Dolosigranulum pigrum]RAN52895.1 transcriptional regulator [Dolosigranulum pigrum]
MTRRSTIEVENKLYEYRVLARMSQEKLGEVVGVSRQTINSIEKNKYIPSLPVALSLAKYFDVRVEEIFKIKGDDEIVKNN